jgi:uncharacterized protein YdiU (UPF0061 family)
MGLQAKRDNETMNQVTAHAEIVDAGLPWSNRFQQLGTSFYTPLAPQPLPSPYWVARAWPVADLIGLEHHQFQLPTLLNALSGNLPIRGTQPLASVYSGHQFGQWAGQLGDGRAILLGEVKGFEVQLKGSGLTPYSRMGDGRAVLRSSIREFLCSEAMHALGIPTTRALCVTGSDEPVRRETWETAAVVTRVATSFIRFGHFQHFAAANQLIELQALADYVIDRYYPDCRSDNAFGLNAYAALLQSVTERTAVMVAHWQTVGFCHGVMNTDNMSILGLTMDYGPFQFLDAYEPGHICNHSDREGRYAFDQQPDIAHWNLYALAQALLPLIGEQALALQALKAFKPVFTASFHQMICAKLGISPDANDETHTLISDILNLLANDRVDYTIFWRRLSHARHDGNLEPVRDMFINRSAIDAWLLHYSKLSEQDEQGLSADLMLKHNPKFVLRNYLGEQAIRAAKVKDFSGVENLLKLLQSPYDEHPEFETLAGFVPDWASQINISCSP